MSHGSTIPAPKDKGSSRNVGASGEFAGGRLLVGSIMGSVANPSTSDELLFSRHSSLPQLSLIKKDHTIEPYTPMTSEGWFCSTLPFELIT